MILIIDSLAHPLSDLLAKTKHESIPNERAQITSFALWQCNSQMNTFSVMITPILIICSLTVLLFGFDSSARIESNRF